jgi:DNA-binding MarR family transcriptional regulator
MQESKDKESPNIASQLMEFMQLLGKSTSGPFLSILVESGLTLPQIITLHILSSQGEHTVSLIAEKLKLSKAATSHLVDVMVRHGYVTRIEDEVDRRKKSVSVTGKGSRMLERIEKSRMEGLERATGMLATETRVELETVLRKVVEQLRKHQCAQHPGGEKC